MEDIKKAYKTHKKEIENRLKEFSNLKKENWFNELAFCILTPQSNAEKCWQAIEKLKEKEFEDSVIEACLIKNTRFHKNKTRYLKEARRDYGLIEKKIREINENNVKEIRNWIAENVTGLGLKESSHFLRNIGKSYNQLAILDRHILRRMLELGMTDSIEMKNKKIYWENENKLIEFSKKTGIPADELDLLFWKIESGRIFK